MSDALSATLAEALRPELGPDVSVTNLHLLTGGQPNHLLLRRGAGYRGTPSDPAHRIGHRGPSRDGTRSCRPGVRGRRRGSSPRILVASDSVAALGVPFLICDAVAGETIVRRIHRNLDDEAPPISSPSGGHTSTRWATPPRRSSSPSAGWRSTAPRRRNMFWCMAISGWAISLSTDRGWRRCWTGSWSTSARCIRTWRGSVSGPGGSGHRHRWAPAVWAALRTSSAPTNASVGQPPTAPPCTGRWCWRPCAGSHLPTAGRTPSVRPDPLGGTGRHRPKGVRNRMGQLGSPGRAVSTGRLIAAELVAAVAEFLAGEVRAATSGAVSFHALVAANALRIVERELLDDTGAKPRAALARLGFDDEDTVSAAIRSGELDDRSAEVIACLRSRQLVLAVAGSPHPTAGLDRRAPPHCRGRRLAWPGGHSKL